jgi:hypothetical protein
MERQILSLIEKPHVILWPVHTAAKVTSCGVVRKHEDPQCTGPNLL